MDDPQNKIRSSVGAAVDVDVRLRPSASPRTSLPDIRERTEVMRALLARPFLNAEEAATIIGIHPASIRRFCRTGNLRAHRIGKRLWRIRPEALRAWADGRNAETP